MFTLVRRPWLRWLGYLTCAVTVTLYLSNCLEEDLLRATYTSNRSGILRPGQFQQVVAVAPVVDEVEYKGPVEADEMGMAHDLRFVTILNVLWISRYKDHAELAVYSYRNKQFYRGGTLTLTNSESVSASHPVPYIYDPYPAYNSRKWKKEFRGKFQPCLGPSGHPLDRRSAADMVQVYRGQQDGFPAPSFGSYEALGLDRDVCTDRYSRFGPYGYDEDSEDEVPGFTRPAPVLWWEVDWNRLQSLCSERNVNRYKSIATVSPSSQSPLALGLPQAPNEPGEIEPAEPAGTSNAKQFYPRSAVLIRAWSGLDWTPNHREYLRALIMELSLHSGGEYEVYLLIHVKDDEMPIFSNTETINWLRNHIPKEFRNMALFFNKNLLEAWYPRIKEHRYINQTLHVELLS